MVESWSTCGFFVHQLLYTVEFPLFVASSTFFGSSIVIPFVYYSQSFLHVVLVFDITISMRRVILRNICCKKNSSS